MRSIIDYFSTRNYMKGVAFYALINCEWLCFWVNGIQSDDLNLGQGVLFSLLDHIPQKVGWHLLDVPMTLSPRQQLVLRLCLLELMLALNSWWHCDPNEMMQICHRGCSVGSDLLTWDSCDIFINKSRKVLTTFPGTYVSINSVQIVDVI